MTEQPPIADKDAGLIDAIRAECDRLACAADRYDQAGQYEYAGGLREAAHHVSTLLAAEAPMPDAEGGAPRHMPCDMGCQPDWHRDDCAIYLPAQPAADKDAHKFIWDVIGFECRCGGWKQRHGPVADAEANHAAHVAQTCVTSPGGPNV